MIAQTIPSRVVPGGHIAPLLLGLLLAAGCDMGLETSANRYEQLNKDTKELIDVLRQVKDEATAKEHLAELKEAAEKVRDVQKRILDSQAEGKGEGMGRITNFRQASLWEQGGDAARRQVERIREADEKAGVIVDEALTGIIFPEPYEGY